MLKATSSNVNVSQITGVLPVVNGGTGATTSTGTGNTVLSAAPTLSGNVTLSTGNLIVASGQGIDFSADPSAAGMTSELLDDYEEGTWTPSDQSGAGLIFTVGFAKYTKVGRAVSIQGAITYPSTASTASAQFAGFPFNASDSIQMSVIYSDASVANFTYFSGNTTGVFALTPGVNVTNATLSGKFISFAGTYFV